MTEAETSLDTLMDDTAPALLRYAERLVRDPHDAQDVVQQVFIRFAGLEETKRPRPGAERAWLYRATHNRAVDLIRASQRRRSLHERQAAEPKPETSTTDQRMAEVLAHLDALEDKERAVISLRLESGLSYRDIAEATGIKEGYVGYLLHQAVRKLSEALHPPGGPS